MSAEIGKIIILTDETKLSLEAQSLLKDLLEQLELDGAKVWIGDLPDRKHQ